MAQTNEQELQEKQSKEMEEGLAFVVERRGRKRKRKRKRKKMREEGGRPLCQDPLDVLGRDLMLKVLNNLDARSVALCLVVSRTWNRVASSDTLWTSKCEELWHGKAHIPRLSLVRGISKLDAYSLSVMDGKRVSIEYLCPYSLLSHFPIHTVLIHAETCASMFYMRMCLVSPNQSDYFVCPLCQNRIMKDDLCDHVWEFHFTKAAPEYWRNLDPYWKGSGPPMHRYFHPDGSQTADPGDKVWGGHECCYSIVTGIIGEGKIREHYVRINRWLPLAVSRKQDWSWEMSNSLYCYSSVPDAYKEGGTGPLFLVM